ncbi:hypothetical protein P7K49_003243, partial [Saguinus oedipus]
ELKPRLVLEEGASGGSKHETCCCQLWGKGQEGGPTGPRISYVPGSGQVEAT